MTTTWKSILGEHIAFLLLFASEFTYYLLILQTGIVEYHHSVLAEIWMVPVGGMLGIVLSVSLHKERVWLMPFLLFMQLILSFSYASANGLELFGLGLLSGLTAPMLIYRIQNVWFVVVALALSYTFGTAMFHVAAIERTNIALFLTLIALLSSFFAQMKISKIVKMKNASLYTMVSVFFWLLLDATLFETLSRDSFMHLWGQSSFTAIIIASHIVGLIVAYSLRVWKHTDLALLGLFALTYTVYSTGDPLTLSLVYPFVISYYNVIILNKLSQLHYLPLAIISLALWGASGLGLMIALSHTFVLAWIVLGILALMTGLKLFAVNPFYGFLHSITFKG